MKKSLLSSFIVSLLIVGCAGPVKTITKNDIGQNNAFIVMLLNAGDAWGSEGAFDGTINTSSDPSFYPWGFLNQPFGGYAGNCRVNVVKVPAMKRNFRIYYTESDADQIGVKFNLDVQPDKLYGFYFEADYRREKLILNIYEVDKDGLLDFINLQSGEELDYSICSDFYDLVLPIIKSGKKVKSNLVFEKIL